MSNAVAALIGVATGAIVTGGVQSAGERPHLTLSY
jgi:hypothetical protein